MYVTPLVWFVGIFGMFMSIFDLLQPEKWKNEGKRKRVLSERAVWRSCRVLYRSYKQLVSDECWHSPFFLSVVIEAWIKAERCLRLIAAVWHFTHWLCFLLSALTITSYMETEPSAISEAKNTCEFLFYCTSPVNKSRSSFLAHNLHFLLLLKRQIDSWMLNRMLQNRCFSLTEKLFVMGSGPFW